MPTRFHVKHCARECGAREADAVIEQAEIAIKYAGYIDKQNDEVDRASALREPGAARRPGLRRR